MIRKLTDDEFVELVKKDELAAILVKTANCPKCKALEKRIEELNNPMDILSYTSMNPGNEAANKILMDVGVTSVPFLIIAENGNLTIHSKQDEIDLFINADWTP
jgi:glutaredoxin